MKKQNLYKLIGIAFLSLIIAAGIYKFNDLKNTSISNSKLVGTICTADALICPDGTSVSRIAPECKFAACPEIEKLDIVTSFYPLEYFTKEIVGDKANVINLAGANDVHEYTLTAQDRVKLEKSDLVVYVDSWLEKWVGDVVFELNNEGKDTVSVVEGVDLYKIDLSDDFTEDDHVAFDPHVWLDPVLAQEIVKNISEKIKEIDPVNSKIYNENTQNLITKLKDLDYAYTSGLYDCKHRDAIVSHNAFGYLARRYDFETYPIAGISTMDQPSAKALAELKNYAKDNIKYILAEENSVKRFAQTLADEVGMEMLPVNPMGRGTFDTQKDYFDVSKQNLESFKTAFECQ